MASRVKVPRAFLAALIAIAAAAAAFALSGTALAQTSLNAADARSESAVQPQAARVGVWVIAKQDGSSKYSYNKNGFLSAIDGGTLGSTLKYSYKGSKLVRYTCRPNPGAILLDSYDRALSYDRKNRLTKLISKAGSGVSRGYNHCSIKYKYNSKGRISKVAGIYDQGKIRESLSYDGKGRLKKIVIRSQDLRGVWSSPITDKFSYNSRGYVSSRTDSYGATQTYRYSFDKQGRLKEVAPDSGSATTFSYKRISVPKKYVNEVKRQQKTLLRTAVPRDFSLDWALVP